MIKKLIAIIVLVVVASLSIAGCTSSTSSNQAASSASSASVTPTPTAIPTSSPTATPQPSGATSIALGIGSGGPPQLDFTKGEAINWVIDVTSQVTGTTVCGGTVTVSIAGVSTTQLTSAPGCFHTAYFTLNSGVPKDGTYKVTLSYSGYGSLQPSTSSTSITVSG